MNIYLVNADRLRFSAEQLEAVSRLHACRDLGGITEGVAWVRDNDDDIIVLASEWRPDSFSGYCQGDICPTLWVYFIAPLFISRCAPLTGGRAHRA